MHYAARIICLGLVGALAGGCNVIGAAAYVVGPPAVEAEYVPAQIPMLVLVEVGPNSVQAIADAEQLERLVMEQLKYHEIAPPADFDPVYSLRLSDPNQFRAMSIAQLGRMAKAQQVLYIDLKESSVNQSEGIEMVRGQVAALVRVVDVTTGETLWPTDLERGYPLQYGTNLTRVDRYNTEADIRRTVQATMADGIVKLFYSYKPE